MTALEQDFWNRLHALAKERGYEWLLGDEPCDGIPEALADGISPEEFLEEEIEEARNCC